MKRAQRLVVSGAAIVALLVGGAAIVGTAPDNDGVLAPFTADAGVGEPVSSRTLEVSVDAVRLARTVSATYSLTPVTVTSEGFWVIVDTTVTPIDPQSTLAYAEIRIGDYRFSVSDLPPAPTLTGYSFGSDVPVRGSLVFELPASAFELDGATDATIAFPARQTPVLDTVPTVHVDLAALVDDAAESITIEPARTPDAVE